MNQQPNELAVMTIFNNPAVIDYLKNLLTKQKDIEHSNVGLHMEAYNSLISSQNLRSQMAALENSIREQLLKQENTKQV